MEARVSLNGAAWMGAAPNISLGGVYMTFAETISANENQPIQLNFLTEAGALEIGGKVRGLREALGHRSASVQELPMGLAVEFEELETIKEKILSSLLDGLREQSVSARLMGLLAPQESGDLLLEIRSAGTDAISHVSIHPCSSGVARSSLPERRLVPRVNLAIPVSLEEGEAFLTDLRQEALTANLSVNGACLRFRGHPNQLSQHLVLRLSIPSSMASRLPDTPVGAFECAVTGEIVWTDPDTVVGDELKNDLSDRPLCMGIRFVSQHEEGLRSLTEVVGYFLDSADRFEERAGTAGVTSVQVECRNAAGRRIAAYHDRPEKVLPGVPVVIISPGYGETKKEYVTLAYYLACNGFHVLRYDHTNHVGESEGDIVDATLTSMDQDLACVTDFVKCTWPTSSIAVVTTSLAGRVALKQVARSPRVDLLILITGVVDVQATLQAVHQEDLILSFLRGVRRGVLNVLGFNVHADYFLSDTIKAGYTNLHTSIQDASQISIPVILFVAEHDAWVQLESVKAVQAALPAQQSPLYLIPEAMHRLHENPRKARAVFQQLVTVCLERLAPECVARGVLEPMKGEIGRQSRIERERARAHHQLAIADLQEFWQDYLSQFQYIANIHDYWHLLDHIYRLMGTLDGEGRILDAGCGNGNFGMFLMINQAYRQRHTSAVDPRPLHYTGMDFVPTALKQAKLNLGNVAAESYGKIESWVMGGASVITSFCRADLNMRLPFRDNQFDRIVCNLVISYLEDPLCTLREFMRVLSPKGKIILTNLKPQADLSQIYRNFVRLADRPEEVEEARQLLTNSGKIRQAEGDGVFRFFDRQELAMLLLSTGAVRPRIFSTFANQAYLAVAEKPGTAK